MGVCIKFILDYEVGCKWRVIFDDYFFLFNCDNV